jgi:hypothetical protein
VWTELHTRKWVTVISCCILVHDAPETQFSGGLCRHFWLEHADKDARSIRRSAVRQRADLEEQTAQEAREHHRQAVVAVTSLGTSDGVF